MIRSTLDDTGWVYVIERVRENEHLGVDVKSEVARVYGWYQITECVESLDRRKGDRFFATPAYKVL